MKYEDFAFKYFASVSAMRFDGKGTRHWATGVLPNDQYSKWTAFLWLEDQCISVHIDMPINDDRIPRTKDAVEVLQGILLSEEPNEFERKTLDTLYHLYDPQFLRDLANVEFEDE